MAWAPDYCTTAELKAWVRVTDTDDDTLLAVAITSASRAIDGLCGRQFGNITTAAVRYYTWDGGTIDCRDALRIDDLYSTTDLAVVVDTDADSTTTGTIVVDTDFMLWPYNAAADGRPWTHLVSVNAPAYRYGRWARGVAITARWGWSAVPAAVKQATLTQAARFFARRNAPFGVAGSPELGSELRLLERLDPDVAAGLASFVRPWGAV